MSKNNRIVVTKDLVEKIADLAMIELSEIEIEKYQKQLDSILDYVDMLREVDTSSIEEKSHTELKNVLREDFAEDSLLQEKVLLNRQKTSRKGYFVLSSVIDK